MGHGRLEDVDGSLAVARGTVKIRLVAGAGGVTVSAAMKTLSAKAEISRLAIGKMIFQTVEN